MSLRAAYWARVLTYSNYDVDAGHQSTSYPGEREDPGNEVGHQFEVLGWKNVAYQQQISKSCDSLQVSARIRSRETAYNWEDSQNKLNVPLPRTNYYKNSFTYSYSGIIHYI